MRSLPPTAATSGAVTNSVPGFNNLSRSATGNIANLLTGLPSASPTQRANAYFGVGSGMPNSDFVRNRGFDLFGEQAEQHKQRGLDDFLKVLQGYSGTVMPTAGQQIQNQQFNAGLQSNEGQFNIQDTLAKRKQALGESQYGLNRPWESTSGGDVFDRANKRLGYDKSYDLGVI